MSECKHGPMHVCEDCVESNNRTDRLWQAAVCLDKIQPCRFPIGTVSFSHEIRALKGGIK